MRSFFLSCAVGSVAIGVSAFGFLISDATGEQKLSGEQISNLALIALVVPHVGGVSALAASKAV
jgi:hypothetical protein